ncbi:MAG: C4-type zinc ribbon domain-containing protein [Dehalococcoidia bacterium]
MSLPEQLHKLQQIDLELQRKQQELDEVENQLSDNEAMVAAESKLASEKEQLEDVKRRQKASEWELEDLQEKVKQIDNKLYGGTTKNPKELVNLEKEVKALKGQVAGKEDALLALMSQVEQIEAKVQNSTEEFGRLKEEHQQRQETLGPRKAELETVLARLGENRHGLAKQIGPEVLDLYERIRLGKGLAVAKVERGRCQGCHITVPTSQWQRAKAGNVIQCNSCNRILTLD